MGPRDADVKDADAKKSENKFKTMEMERSCTDTLCCTLFLAFIGSLVALTAYAVSAGNPYAMVTPFDSVGNRCGMPKQGAAKDQDFTAYKYKYLSQLETLAQTSAGPSTWFVAVCVKSCPAKSVQSDCITNGDVVVAGKQTCPGNSIYGTTLLHGYCMPDKRSIKNIGEKLYAVMDSSGGFASFMHDLQECWQVLVGMAFATVLIALVYVFLLKWIVKPVLYVSMVLILILFVLIGSWSFAKRADYDATTQKKNFDAATAGAAVSWVAAALYALFMCCCWKNISLGASIMEAASAFVTQNVRIIFLPVAAYFVSAAFFAYWIITAIYLYGIGTVTFDANLPVAKVENSQQVIYLFWYFLFGLFWVLAFLIGLQQFIIAAMACMWYFAGQGGDLGDGKNAPGEVSLIKAIHWGTWYHCGSVAFGAFCIAVITMIRVVFEYLANKYEKLAPDGQLYKIIKCVMTSILYCLDEYVKFITKNAYIQIALNNEAFCPAAVASFWLIVRQAGRFGSASIIGWIMMFLGKGTITVISAYLTLLIVQYKYTQVQQPIIPAAFVGAVGYVVGSLFLSIFSFSSTAILHCFIMAEDSAENSGSKVPSPPSLEPFLKECAKARPSAAYKESDESSKVAEANKVE